MSVAGSAISSISGSTQIFSRIVKDFKKALSERATPNNLLILNKIIFFILSATIALSSLSFVLEKNNLASIEV